MNRKLFEKQVNELIDFFEKQPTQTKTFSVLEYKNILKGLILIITNTPESIDFNESYTFLETESTTDKSKLLTILEIKIMNCNSHTTLNYKAITGVLDVYLFCLKEENSIRLDTQQWLELAGYTRVLEMERLWFNTKK